MKKYAQFDIIELFLNVKYLVHFEFHIQWHRFAKDSKDSKFATAKNVL